MSEFSQRTANARKREQGNREIEQKSFKNPEILMKANKQKETLKNHLVKPV